MTIKELKQHYTVYGRYSNEYPYLVYTKEAQENWRTVHRYLCSVKIIGRRITIIEQPGKSYNKLNDLKQAISSYTTSLPYDSGYYDPAYRKGVFEELIIHDYLSDRGFNSEHTGGGMLTYELANKNIYGGKIDTITLSINGLSWTGFKDDKIPEEVKIILWTGQYSWVENKCKREVGEIIKSLDSLLKPLLLTNGVTFVNESDKYKAEQFNATINKLGTNTFKQYSKEYKEELKVKMQEIIDKL